MRRLLLLATLALAVLCALPVTASAVTAWTLDGSNNLLRFDTGSTTTILATTPITGLQGSDTLDDLDMRPQTGQLYGVGGGNHLYTLDPSTGVATLVGTFAPAVSGAAGIDFNPVVDLLRLVSSTGQNLRINPVTGATTSVDMALNPGTPSVSANAYDSNFAGTTTTALFDYEFVTDTLKFQSPPNSGTLTNIGASGVGTNGRTALDVAAPGQGGALFGLLTVSGTARLFTINTGTGAATQVGVIGAGSALHGLALDVAAGAPATLAYGNTLVGGASEATAVFRNPQAGSVILTPTFAGPNAGDFSVTSTTCPLVIATGSACTLNIRFQAGAAGPRAASLVLNEVVAGTITGSPTIALTGTGVASSNGTNGTNGTNGANGGTGAQGPAGPTGAAGPTGPKATVTPLVLVAFPTKLRARAAARVALSYVLTRPARITLTVTRGRTKVATVKANGRRGRNSITWNGKSGSRKVKVVGGAYKLVLDAVASDRSKARDSAALTLVTPKPKKK